MSRAIRRPRCANDYRQRPRNDAVHGRLAGVGDRRSGRFWLKTVHRREVSESADLADEYLATDAHHKGELLAEGLRAVTVGLLRLYFTGREPDRIVEVAYVRRVVRGP